MVLYLQASGVSEVEVAAEHRVEVIGVFGDSLLAIFYNCYMFS